MTFEQKAVHPPGQYVTVNGSKLWVEIEGEGEPLLLIAGGPGFSHVLYHPYYSQFADKYQVIYFDALAVANQTGLNQRMSILLNETWKTLKA